MNEYSEDSIPPQVYVLGHSQREIDRLNAAYAGRFRLIKGIEANILADGTVALPPGGPNVIYAQDQNVGGANPYTPFGTDPGVPYGVWAH